jgi:hypothetical protein
MQNALEIEPKTYKEEILEENIKLSERMEK